MTISVLYTLTLLGILAYYQFKPNPEIEAEKRRAQELEEEYRELNQLLRERGIRMD